MSDKNEKKSEAIKNKYTIKRAETSKDNLNKNIQDEDKIKFLKLILNFKSIKNKIKQRIILRPEEEEDPKRDEKKIGKKNGGQVRILIVDNDMRLSGRLWISFSH